MSQRARFKFRLYMAGHAVNSTRAAANLQSVCREHLPGRYEIEFVDMLAEPLRARSDGVRMAPTLMVLMPNGVSRLVGGLGHLEIMRALGLESLAA